VNEGWAVASRVLHRDGEPVEVERVGRRVGRPSAGLERELEVVDRTAEHEATQLLRLPEPEEVQQPPDPHVVEQLARHRDAEQRVVHPRQAGEPRRAVEVVVELMAAVDRERGAGLVARPGLRGDQRERGQQHGHTSYPRHNNISSSGDEYALTSGQENGSSSVV
jgi:hypothetical protein